jgi:signal transduction histidine kinase
MLVGDSDLIGLAVSNLLENAVKHTPPGAKITVRLEVANGQSALSFEDGGPGLSAAEFARVVEPFARLDLARSTSGAGLGLAIVAAVMRLHGGSLERVEARQGLHLRCQFGATTRSDTQ